MKVLLIALLAIPLSALADEGARIKVCADKAHFSYSATVARDRGLTKPDVQERIKAITDAIKMDKAEQAEMMLVIDMVYSSALSPDEFSDKFFNACLSNAGT